MATNVKPRKRSPPDLTRIAFETPREMDFFDEANLQKQIGHPKRVWPRVLFKELVDNSLDACENAKVSPKITITVDPGCITFTDNGPGIKPSTVSGVLDFAKRVSSTAAYVSPTRGQQGNALKTVVAMPFVLDGECGRVDISAHGIRHEITVRVSQIRGKPIIDHKQIEDPTAKNGTSVKVYWTSSQTVEEPQFLQNTLGEEGLANPDDDGDEAEDGPLKADLGELLNADRRRFLQFAESYTFLNPHLDLTVDWLGEQWHCPAVDPNWSKWMPCNPTCPNWYTKETFSKLVAATIAHGSDHGSVKNVREFLSEFRGLSSRAKQDTVLKATGLDRQRLTALAVDEHNLNSDLIDRLLAAMQEQTRCVKPQLLGLIGQDHLAAKLEGLGCEMETYKYQRFTSDPGEAQPWVVEFAFAVHKDGFAPSGNEIHRRMVTGINFSPCINNPFRELTSLGISLDSLLEQQRAGSDEPVVMVLHLVRPRVDFSNSGKAEASLD